MIDEERGPKMDVFIGYFPDPEKPTELPESVKQFAAECDKAGVSYCMPALPMPVKGSPEYSGYVEELVESAKNCGRVFMIVGRNADTSYAIWSIVAEKQSVTFFTLPEPTPEKFKESFSKCIALSKIFPPAHDSKLYPDTPENWAEWLSFTEYHSAPDFGGEWLTIAGTRQGILNSILYGYTPASDREADILRRYANTLCDLMLKEDAWLPQRKYIHKCIQAMPRNEEYCACLMASRSFVVYSDYYCINLKKLTYIVLSTLAKSQIAQCFGGITIVAEVIDKLWNCQFKEKDLAIFKTLDSNSGAVCLVREARTERKNGIDKNYLSKFHGECANNDIPCQFRHHVDKCGCGPAQVETVCEKLVEDGILGKKGDRYYY